MHWVSSTLAEAAAASTGFFRIQRDWDWVSLIKSSPQDAALIDDRAGRMAAAAKCKVVRWAPDRSEEHTSELQSLMRISYAVFCLNKKIKANHTKLNISL